MTTQAATLRAVALSAAQAGADAIRVAAGAGLVVTAKGPLGTDVVTSADLAAEDAIRTVLRTARPDDAVQAEESGEEAGESGLRWVVDPLDGTVNFSRGSDRYAVSVAVRADDDALFAPARAAAVVRPATGEHWSVGHDDPSAPTRTRAWASDPREAVLAFAVPHDPQTRSAAYVRLARVAPRVLDLRNTGSSVCDLVAVALGEVDAFVSFDPAPWDVAAGVALVEAAGGVCRVRSTAAGGSVLVVGARGVVDAVQSGLW
ncbi:inositol monophosphatase family protein [Cellulomonas wangsupingiae]|uniref:inositol monophosphatase family protein n=1 Tax=Cellulomonas wangsupingiae TaxID=2968085 RepID=UPI001D0DF636|nr:inositol monophosphatase family protein [Cellulomonas wangsupingiae]MCM0640410.1 inositol monophosphatase family protein [Cellulomonas wangsupingiae]